MNLVELETQYDFLNHKMTMVLTYSLTPSDTDLNSLTQKVCHLVQTSTAFLPAAKHPYTFDSAKTNDHTLVITCTHPNRLGAIAEYQTAVNDTYTATSQEQIRTYVIPKTYGDTFKTLQDKYKEKLTGYILAHSEEIVMLNEPVVVYCYAKKVKAQKGIKNVLKNYLHILA